MSLTTNDQINAIHVLLEKNYSDTHKVLRSIESDVGKRHYSLLEIDMDKLENQITELRDLVTQKKKLEGLKI